MRCPFCQALGSRVIDSRSTEDHKCVRRRRECTACGARFTTYERWEETPLMVVKRDGRRESFARSKVLGGVLKALEKRPVPLEDIEKMVDEVERELRSRPEREVTSIAIGEMVMERLREMDEVAYVRFASVYRQFKDINRFIEELEKLLPPRE
ncbi:MAG: transcriptional regulator NrdR [Limnochordia bacterium]|jgi:transcriptional repressor NrdR|nr:transcriptional repressor NrdR [Bacillota bacterium]